MHRFLEQNIKSLDPKSISIKLDVKSLERKVLIDPTYKAGVVLVSFTDTCINGDCQTKLELAGKSKNGHPMFYSSQLQRPTKGTVVVKRCRTCSST